MRRRRLAVKANEVKEEVEEKTRNEFKWKQNFRVLKIKPDYTST